MKYLVAAASVVAMAVAAPVTAKSVVTADRYLDVATGRYVEHPAIFIDDNGRITSIADARTVRWGSRRQPRSTLPGRRCCPA